MRSQLLCIEHNSELIGRCNRCRKSGCRGCLTKEKDQMLFHTDCYRDRFLCEHDKEGSLRCFACHTYGCIQCFALKTETGLYCHQSCVEMVILLADIVRWFAEAMILWIPCIFLAMLFISENYILFIFASAGIWVMMYIVMRWAYTILRGRDFLHLDLSNPTNYQQVALSWCRFNTWVRADQE